MMEGLEAHRWGWLVLAASATTLVCCALPILLVGLGLGALSAALFANIPLLATIAVHKGWFFLASAVLIGLGAWFLFRPGRQCPADPLLAAHCRLAERWNRRLLAMACMLWLIGAGSAYLALPIMNLFDRI